MENIKDAFLQELTLTSTSPSEHAERVVLDVLHRIEHKNQIRKDKTGKRKPLVCMTVKIPSDEMAKIRGFSDKWRIPYTDITRFLLLNAMPVLYSPSDEVKPLLEAALNNYKARKLAEEQRKAAWHAKQEAAYGPKPPEWT
jgi:hypothetical protein